MDNVFTKDVLSETGNYFGDFNNPAFQVTPKNIMAYAVPNEIFQCRARYVTDRCGNQAGT